MATERKVQLPKRIYIFDVDGTLTKPRNRITPDMLDFLKDLRQKAIIGFVGGSDLDKQKEQIGDDVLDLFDYSFPQNGLVAYKDGKQFALTDLKSKYSDKQLNPFLNFVLKYIAELDIPVKRGTFIEFRSGLINISPIGRNCSQKEREEFLQYDTEHKIREKMVAVLREKFKDLDLTFSIGGQISFDVFPRGWDKTFCLQYLEKEFDEIFFFGDKTYPGGNDHEIYEDARTKGHAVETYDDTKRIVTEYLKATS